MNSEPKGKKTLKLSWHVPSSASSKILLHLLIYTNYLLSTNYMPNTIPGYGSMMADGRRSLPSHDDTIFLGSTQLLFYNLNPNSSSSKGSWTYSARVIFQLIQLNIELLCVQVEGTVSGVRMLNFKSWLCYFWWDTLGKSLNLLHNFILKWR